MQRCVLVCAIFAVLCSLFAQDPEVDKSETKIEHPVTESPMVVESPIVRDLNNMKVHFKDGSFHIFNEKVSVSLKSAISNLLDEMPIDRFFSTGVIHEKLYLVVDDLQTFTWKQLKAFLTACAYNKIKNIQINDTPYQLPYLEIYIDGSLRYSNPGAYYTKQGFRAIIINKKDDLVLVKNLPKSKAKIYLSVYVAPATQTSWVLQTIENLNNKNYYYYFREATSFVPNAPIVILERMCKEQDLVVACEVNLRDEYMTNGGNSVIGIGGGGGDIKFGTPFSEKPNVSKKDEANSE